MTLRCTIQLRDWADFLFGGQTPRQCWVCRDLRLPLTAPTFPRIIYMPTGEPRGLQWRCEAHGYVREYHLSQVVVKVLSDRFTPAELEETAEAFRAAGDDLEDTLRRF